MSQPIKFTATARYDLNQIATYTSEAWGGVQTKEYMATLETAFLNLLDNPKLGRKRQRLPKGYFSFTVSRHVIFYRIVKKQILIVRILHHSMDVASHLE
jgi:toxin ParE1/3/4